MQNFGYIKNTGLSNNGSSSALFSEITVRSGLHSLQQFAGLPVTGILDDATKKVHNVL